MTRRVVYSPRAERHLKGLYDWIATASSPETAERYVLSILDHCDRLADFPMVGVAHDDIRPGLRTLGFRRRAVIAFTVTEATSRSTASTTVAATSTQSSWQRMNNPVDSRSRIMVRVPVVVQPVGRGGRSATWGCRSETRRHAGSGSTTSVCTSTAARKDPRRRFGLRP